MVSLTYIYDAILSKKVKNFKCPVCSVDVEGPKSIRLDMLTFQYFDYLKDGKANFNMIIQDATPN